MKIRIKFTKTGKMKYIGHLDLMRFFQKVIRRAGINITYSQGFSPHMEMSFAQPLGVGMESKGEYFDFLSETDLSSEEIVNKFNEYSIEEIRVKKAVSVEDKKATNCMSLVEAADYRIDFENADEKFTEELERFLSENDIQAIKKSKKNESKINIKPLIFNYKSEKDNLLLRLSTGSKANLNPRLVMNCFFDQNETYRDSVKYSITRTEIYSKVADKFIPLYKLGQEIRVN